MHTPSCNEKLWHVIFILHKITILMREDCDCKIGGRRKESSWNIYSMLFALVEFILILIPNPCVYVCDIDKYSIQMNPSWNEVLHYHHFHVTSEQNTLHHIQLVISLFYVSHYDISCHQSNSISFIIRHIIAGWYDIIITFLVHSYNVRCAPLVPTLMSHFHQPGII